MKEYIIIFLLALFCCHTSCGKTNNVGKITRVTIGYEGNIDKALPAIVFCLCCKESVSVGKYTFNMNAVFFEELAKCISSNNFSQKPQGDIALSVKIQSKEQRWMFFLKKNEARLLLKQIIISKSESNEVMNEQLARYKKILGV